MVKSSKRKLSKEEQQRQERLSRKFAMHEAALKRAESRMARAFNAWQRARAQLARTIKAIERPPVEADTSGGMPFDDALPSV